MATQVKIWTMEEDFALPKFYNKVKIFGDETYATLRVRLEEKAALDWSFVFWDSKEHCRIREKMEGLNDVMADVYVVPALSEAQEVCKRRKLDEDAPQSEPEAAAKERLA